jgi:hypothetical protein
MDYRETVLRHELMKMGAIVDELSSHQLIALEADHICLSQSRRYTYQKRELSLIKRCTKLIEFAGTSPGICRYDRAK